MMITLLLMCIILSTVNYLSLLGCVFFGVRFFSVIYVDNAELLLNIDKIVDPIVITVTELKTTSVLDNSAFSEVVL